MKRKETDSSERTRLTHLSSYDFYIPGYKRSKRDSSDPNIHIGDVYWNFEPKLYKAFQLEMEQNYDIPFSSTAYLLLMEVGSPGNFKRVLKIGLEGNGKDIRDVAEFFRESFEYSKKEIAFEEISNWILKKENLKERSENLQKIYKILGNVAITSVIKTLFFA